MNDRTKPSPKTRDAERDEASAPHEADRMPTSDEERAASRTESDPDVAAHYEEMAERGANQQGEGRIA